MVPRTIDECKNDEEPCRKCASVEHRQGSLFTSAEPYDFRLALHTMTGLPWCLFRFLGMCILMLSALVTTVARPNFEWIEWLPARGY